MRLARLIIDWWWKYKWIIPRYGLEIDDYYIGMVLWVDGHETEVIKINKKKIKLRTI